MKRVHNRHTSQAQPELALTPRAAHVVGPPADHNPWCVGQTKDGHPRHPLYVRADQPLVRWEP